MFEFPYIPVSDNVRPVTIECISSASQHYNVHSDYIYLLMAAEGHEVGQVVRNTRTDNSLDISIAAINSIHLPELERAGFTYQNVLNDGCLGVFFMAYYLKSVTKGQPTPKTELELFKLIARYHSKTPKHNLAYARRLQALAPLIWK